MTKFTPDKIPVMKPKDKPKKLGLLTPKKRKNITFRFQQETIERLNDLLERSRININHKISRTDILEALTLAATQNTNTELKNMLLGLGLCME